MGPLWKLYPSKVFYCETLPYFTQFCSVREIFGVAPLGPGGAEGMAAVSPAPLRECDPGGETVYDPTLRRGVRRPWALRFVEWGGVLVYDADHPEVFARYTRMHRPVRTPTWSPDGHGGCAAAVQGAVWLLLLIARRLAQGGTPLPPLVWRRVFAGLGPAAWDRHGPAALLLYEGLGARGGPLERGAPPSDAAGAGDGGDGKGRPKKGGGKGTRRVGVARRTGG